MIEEIWRNRWLSCINELTSLRLQRESWLDKTNSNPHWSFVEFMCSYFDDLGIDNNYAHQLNNDLISNKEFEIIKPWHELLDKYNSPKNDDYDVEKILEDKEWQLIVEKGVKVKIELSNCLNEAENQILNEEIDYRKYK
ncbi:hypothetical protein [Algivirga pacifica]|uniref:DUF4240 domain-containing protein n=1 Tax=Algivirga pacifica TaxID=1162670 RepID=A0ABP9DFS3_9BACT